MNTKHDDFFDLVAELHSKIARDSNTQDLSNTISAFSINGYK